MIREVQVIDPPYFQYLTFAQMVTSVLPPDYRCDVLRPRRLRYRCGRNPSAGSRAKEQPATFSLLQSGFELSSGRCYTRTQRPLCFLLGMALLGSTALGASRPTSYVPVHPKALHQGRATARKDWRKSGQKAIAPQ